MRKWLILFFAPVILALVNFSIWKNEQLIEHGQTVLLELAPVDPRSLMQGDYMALRFAMANNIRQHLDDKTENLDGKVIVQLDGQQRASFIALDKQQALAENQLHLQFRLRNGQVKFATNAFFFQEGTGSLYEQGKYGRFSVGPEGQLLLTHLVDAELQTLGQSKLLQLSETTN